MSGSLRLVKPGTPPKTHDHWDIRVDSGRVLRFHDPRRFGSLHWTEADPTQHPLLARLGARALERRVRRRVPVPRDPQTQRRHQTMHHEFAARRGRRQHLRERGLVSRAHRAAPRGSPSHRAKKPRRSRKPSKTCSARRSKSAAPRCAITSMPTARPDISARSYLCMNARERLAACASRPSSSSSRVSVPRTGVQSVNAEASSHRRQ